VGPVADCGISCGELLRAMLSRRDERLVPMIERARTMGLV
jgi:hypothetical protein